MAACADAAGAASTVPQTARAAAAARVGSFRFGTGPPGAPGVRCVHSEAAHLVGTRPGTSPVRRSADHARYGSAVGCEVVAEERDPGVGDLLELPLAVEVARAVQPDRVRIGAGAPAGGVQRLVWASAAPSRRCGPVTPRSPSKTGSSAV